MYFWKCGWNRNGCGFLIDMVDVNLASYISIEVREMKENNDLRGLKGRRNQIIQPFLL